MRARILLLAVACCLVGCGTPPRASAEGLPERWRNSIGMTVVLIPGGTFTYGGQPEQDLAPRLVTLSPFYVGQSPVTKGQFQAFLHDTGSTRYYPSLDPRRVLRDRNEEGQGDPPFSLGDRTTWAYSVGPGDEYPMACNWDDADAFCSWLARHEGRPYRLISEAQWEYVARDGTDLEAWWTVRPQAAGSNWNYEISDLEGSTPFYQEGIRETYPATRRGVFGMNMTWEWCRDWYGTSEATDPVTDPTGPLLPSFGHLKVVRGVYSFGRDHRPKGDLWRFRIVCAIDAKFCAPRAPEIKRPEPVPVHPLEQQTLTLDGPVSLVLQHVPAATFKMGRPTPIDRSGTRD